jgi:hypothetical protein
VVVWPVKPTLREALDQPSEQRLVAGVHPKGHLRLLPVPSERPLSDQEANEDAALEVADGHAAVLAVCCFTVKKNVKQLRRGGASLVAGCRHV